MDKNEVQNRIIQKLAIRLANTLIEVANYEVLLDEAATKEVPKEDENP